MCDGRKETSGFQVLPDARPPEAVLVQQEGYNWLESRAGRLGFSVERDLVRADGYRQHRFRKWDGSQGVVISTIDFNGVLTVTDPDQFEETLVTGVGPAKSFGCGPSSSGRSECVHASRLRPLPMKERLSSFFWRRVN